MALIRRNNSKTYHRRVFAGQLQRLTLIKRDDDQQEGTQRTLTIFQAWRSEVSKSGEPIQAGMAATQTVTWYVPKTELDRVGVDHVNVLDRLIDKQYGTGVWQPESDQQINTHLWGNYVEVNCVSLKAPL